MPGHPTWSWARTKNVSSAPRPVQAPPQPYDSTLGSGLRSSLPFNASPLSGSCANLATSGAHHSASAPAWYAQANGHLGDSRLTNPFQGQPKAEAATLVGHY